jgi:hypothetical protein
MTLHKVVPDDEGYDAIAVHELRADQTLGPMIAWVKYDPERRVLGWGKPGERGQEDANVGSPKAAPPLGLDEAAQADLNAALRDLLRRVEKDAARLPVAQARRLRKLAKELAPYDGEPPPWL